ncbi:MAG: glycosyltransferase [Candidatus Heimdallarchaeota archaeon]
MKALDTALIEKITENHLGLIIWLCPETPHNVVGGLGQVSTYVPAKLAKYRWFILQIGRGYPSEEYKRNQIILRDPYNPDQVYPRGKEQEEAAIHSLAAYFEKISKKVINFMREVREGRTHLSSEFPTVMIAHDHFTEPAVMRTLNQLKAVGMKIVYEVHNEALGAHLGYLLSENRNVPTSTLKVKAKQAVKDDFRHLREVSIFDRFKEGKIDALLSVSNAMLNHYTLAYDLPEGNKFRAPNGIPTDEFMSVPNEKIQINLVRGKIGTCVWIGRPVPEKGLTQLFSELPFEYRAFVALGFNSYVQSLVKKHSVDKNILVMAPKRPVELDSRVTIDTTTICTHKPSREQFKQVLETYDFVPYDMVLFAFWMPKIDILSNVTVFVGNSSYEPSGIIQLEATACGTPTIVSEQRTKDGYPRSGMTEYYPDKKGIVSILPEEIGALSFALRQFLEPDFLTEKRNEAKKLRDTITWEYAVKTFWLNFLKDITAK